MASNDPAFEAKAADIIGLYLVPPAHAAVFCVDEKSAIQALDRLDPVLRFLRDGPSVMGSSISVTAPSLSMPPSRPKAARSSQAPRATPVRSSSAFSKTHPNVSLHYTPTYSSWLNQVENWFSKVQRHVIARGVFESVADLRRKLMRYIKAYNKTATPLQWTFSNPTNRIAA
jgi:hypothetical protein